MTRTYGEDTYGSGTYGGSSSDLISVDITYLIASHDPSIILIARRGTGKLAGHRASFGYSVRRRDRLSNSAGHRVIRGQRAAHRPSIRKRGSA